MCILAAQQERRTLGNGPPHIRSVELAGDQRPSDRSRWTRILVESFVIIASILLALGAQALWQERVDRSEEQAILAALHAEFVGNEAVLTAQSDSIGEAIRLVASAVSMSASELAVRLESDEGMAISMAIRRPWTVEFRVGVLESTLGTQRVSLISSDELLADLTQYQAVRNELGEIGDLVTTLAVEAFVASNQLPQSYDRLVALLEAKLGYWDAYHRYLGRLLSHTKMIAAHLEAEID